MSRQISPSTIVGLIIAFFLIGPSIWLMSEPGVLKKMLIIVGYNPGFWVAVFLAVAFGLYRKVTNPLKFKWSEVPIQIVTVLLGTFLIYSVLFYSTTELADTELWNGKVTQAEFLEEWNEEVTWEECDTEGKNCQEYSRIDHHPAKWYIHTNNVENKSISKSVYANYVEYYGAERHENLYHSGQVSIGDGDRYYVNYPGRIKPIWTAIEHQFVNIFAASQSIKLRKGSAEKFQKYLRPYPIIHGGKFGPIEVDRVVLGGATLPEEWIRSVDRGLDEALTVLGKKKQVNVLTYMVNTSDQSFLHALEEHWVYGKKNDVIVIIGTSSFPKIDWVAVIAWTDVELFKTNLRKEVMDLKDLSDSSKLVETIVKRVALPPEMGGFLRKPMEEYQYLISDISLSWWANLLIFLVLGLLSWAIDWALINNTIRIWRR
ncbi:hypothetical protein HOB94_07725 [bacterium]|nr:hypothetical protein [bacterium]